MVGRQRSTDPVGHRLNVCVIPVQKMRSMRPNCIYFVYARWRVGGEPSGAASFSNPSLSRFLFRLDEIEPVTGAGFPQVGKALFQEKAMMSCGQRRSDDLDVGM